MIYESKRSVSEALSYWIDAFSYWIDRINLLVQDEFESGAGFHWTIVGFACGAAWYISLPYEPRLWPLLVSSFLMILVTTFRRRYQGTSSRALVLFTAVICGMTATKIEAVYVSSGKLRYEQSAKVTGWITDSETTSRNRVRLTVLVKDIRSHQYKLGLAAKHKPLKITVATSRKASLHSELGDGISFLARLRPPGGPARPGGYDFARRAWFRGIGASGFVLGKVTPVEIGPAPVMTRLMAPVYRLRLSIADKILKALPSVSGVVAVALTVGEYRAIPSKINDVMRAAGVYHIISISGLHMSMVAGIVLVTIRFLLSLSPWLVEAYNTKKIAVVFAFSLSTFYLLLSGCAVATVRSWVMLSIALLAVMVDRPAITLRTVSVSCGIILLFSPSVVLEPSFLMSFMSVFGLVSGFQWWKDSRERRDYDNIQPVSTSSSWYVLRLIGKWIAGAVLSSLIAGVVTAPVVIHEFYRIATYSWLANVLILPVVGISVMPMAIIGILLMPFGAEFWPLHLMGSGIDAVIFISSWIAGLPGGEGLVGSISPWTKYLSLIGLLWIMLWRTELRWFGFVPIVLACFLVVFTSRPDMMISADGLTISIRDNQGKQRILNPGKNRFAVNTWLLADGDPRDSKAPDLDLDWRCDGEKCRYDLFKGERAGSYATGRLFSSTKSSGSEGELFSSTNPPGPDDVKKFTSIIWLKKRKAQVKDCMNKTIVVTRWKFYGKCARGSLIIDGRILRRTGSLALLFKNGGQDLRVFKALPPSPRLWTARR